MSNVSPQNYFFASTPMKSEELLLMRDGMATFGGSLLKHYL